MGKANQVGEMFGKPIVVYGTEGGIRYSPDDIKKFLRRYTTNETLRFLGEISAKMEQVDSNQALHYFNGVPFSDWALSYLALLSIESSNDFRGVSPDINAIIKALDMYYCLNSPIDDVSGEDITNAGNEFMIRLGASCFDYQKGKSHLLPRTVLLYEQLWFSTPEAREINLIKYFEDIVGLAGC